MEELNLDKVKDILMKQKRYVAVAGLFICFVLILIFFTGSEFNKDRIAKANHVEVSGEDYEPDAAFEVDTYPEINELIQTYFDAYMCADFTTLEQIAYPLSETEMSYITTMSQFYDAYENITCYTKHGLSKDSFIVATRFDIRFSGIDVTAPSMMLFYVQTNEDGELYINNLYSDFNMQYSETAISKDVYTALRKFTTQEDYIELHNEVETQFSDLIKENTDIYQMTKRTIPAARQMWEDTVYYVQNTEDVDDTESTEADEPQDMPEDDTQDTQTDESQDTPEDDSTVDSDDSLPEDSDASEDEAENEETDAEEQVQKVRVKTESGVRVREGAGTSYDIIGEAHDGDEFIKLDVKNDENGEEWTKIQYTDNAVGYIKSSLLY